jgi:hypothetical protein
MEARVACCTARRLVPLISGVIDPAVDRVIGKRLWGDRKPFDLYRKTVIAACPNCLLAPARNAPCGFALRLSGSAKTRGCQAA